MPKIGKKRPKKSPPPATSRGNQRGDENGGINSSISLFTPPAKKRRGYASNDSVLQDLSNNSNPVLEWGEDLTPALVASKLAKMLKSVFGNKDEAIEQTLQLLGEELDIEEEWTPSDDDDDWDEEEDLASHISRLLPKKAPKGVIPVSYKSDIFKYHKLNDTIEVPQHTIYTNVKRCKKKVLEALDYCGTLQHQMFMIHSLLTRGPKAGIGLGLGLLTSPIRDEAAAKSTILRIDNFLHSAQVLGTNTNDSLAFQKTVFMLMTPTAPEVEATDEEWLVHKGMMRDQARLFSLTKSARRRQWDMAIVRRDILAGTHDSGRLVQTYKRNSQSMVNDENRQIVKDWCENKTDLVKASPNQRDSRIVKDETGQDTGIRERVYLYETGKGTLYEEFKKSVANGGCIIARDEEGLVIIGRTTFESLLPANLKLMNKTHKQMCGCKEHLNMELKHAALLNTRKKRLQHFNRLVHLHHPAGTPNHNRAKDARIAFVEMAFTPQRKPIWPTADDAVLAMTCQPVGEENWEFRYECTLGLCQDCTPLPMAPGEDCMTTTNEVNKVTYQENCMTYNCEKHGYIGYTTKCLGCRSEGIPVSHRPKVKGSEGNVYKECSIGEFMTKVYPKQLRMYSQHRWLCHVLGKQGCVGQREQSALDFPGTVLCHRDYTTKLPMEFNNAPMGNGMGGVPTVGMEGMVIKFKDLTDNLEPKLHWFGYLSDEKQQDARTSFTNSTKLIQQLDRMGYLQDEDQVLHIVSDGCTVQYKCANALQTYMWLADGFNTAIDVMITAPYHGKSLVDALAGVDKNLLSQKLIKGFNSATREANGNIISQAKVCLGVLADINRKHGAVTDSKHKKHQGSAKVEERQYRLTNYNEENPIPIKDCTFRINAKQWAKSKKKNKIKEMYQFYYHPDMPLNTCAVRRMPCYCSEVDGCRDQITKPWDWGKTAQDQERFKAAPNCRLTPMMGDMNTWNFITTEMVQDSDRSKNQVNGILQKMLDAHVGAVTPAIKLQHFGAISASNPREPYWLVKWDRLPYQLDVEERVEGCGSTRQPIGTWVCRGSYYNKIPHAPGWYEKARRIQPKLFLLQHVIAADVERERYGTRGHVPPAGAKREYDQRNARADVEFVPPNIVNLILRNRNRLSKLDLYLMNGEDDEVEEEPEVPQRQRRRRILSEGFFDYQSDDDDDDDEDDGDEEEEDDEDIEVEREDEEDNEEQ